MAGGAAAVAGAAAAPSGRRVAASRGDGGPDRMGERGGDSDDASAGRRTRPGLLGAPSEGAAAAAAGLVEGAEGGEELGSG